MSHLARILPIFCLLMLMVNVKGEVDMEVMGLAEDAFDDQYLGCRQAMESHLGKRGVLEAEMSRNRHFRGAWQEGVQIWNEKRKNWDGPDLPEGFGELHGIAVVTYTGFIRDTFNKAVKSAGRSYRAYMDDFHFKFLHYYVTVALQLLYKDCRGKAQPTYRGFDNVLHQLPDGTTMVKFGHFLHTSSSNAEAYDMGNTSFLTVSSCSGVPVDKFSQYPHEKEVLFPGYEVFNIRQVQEDPNEFSLDSTGKWCSNFNCALIQGERSRLSVEECIHSDNRTRPDREMWLRNMKEAFLSAAPAGSRLRSGTASLILLLVAAALAVVV